MTKKDTKGKVKLSLIPNAAMISMAKVREFGINKYDGDDEGWKEVNPRDFIDAALRHIYKYVDVDNYELDPESGLTHLEHALTSLALAVSVEDRIDKELVKSVEDISESVNEAYSFDGTVMKAMCTDIDIEMLDIDIDDIMDISTLEEKIRELYNYGYFSAFIPYSVLKIKEGKSFVKFKI